MKDILSEIIAHKQTEIELQKQTVSPEQLQEQAGIIIRENAAHHRSMKQALAASSTGIISEFKRRSPSKGWINEAARAEEIPAAYEAAGAAALSILTDEKFFGGTLRDIRTARPLVRIPILRKDFIIDSAYDSVYGARPIKRFIQSRVETLIAKAIIQGSYAEGSTLTVDYDGSALVLR
jgi:indole-3-glycerol phosphate synthase